MSPDWKALVSGSDECGSIRRKFAPAGAAGFTGFGSEMATGLND
ncbi:hypothetical protein IQ17_07049 [Bradyrhizobium daqingense]|uniref:Uncharacterized protein n=1 Tax=Bradyrhizobium daqingense TaxID=993502 RepID=A0A562KCK1_9BRAD|nr:hypothetical protein IQ17_07049 [Bradyrhizobium daqingense]